jgi:myo-inositol-1(or 4)-monophosphatase
MSKYKEVITEAILKAGRYVSKAQKRTKNISYKKGKEIVTEADIESEKIRKSILKEHFPNYNYYGEEEGREDKKSKYTFFIDPIDGTGRFIAGTDWYSITIALLKDNKPIVACILIPNTDELFYSELKKGAFLNGKKISVSKRKSFKPSKVSLSSKVWKKGFEKVKSIGVDACLIARGELDGCAKVYKSERMPVEAPAIYLLLKEAGGKMTNFKGKKWDINSEEIALSNGIIHKKLIKNISK